MRASLIAYWAPKEGSSAAEYEDAWRVHPGPADELPGSWVAVAVADGATESSSLATGPPWWWTSLPWPGALRAMPARLLRQLSLSRTDGPMSWSPIRRSARKPPGRSAGMSAPVSKGRLRHPPHAPDD